MRLGRFRRPLSLAFAALALGLAGCGSSSALPFLDLSVRPPVKPAASPSASAPLRVAVAPVITPRENLYSYEPLVKYLSKKIGRPVQYIRTQTYAEINEMMKFGAVDVALVCSYPYLIGKDGGYMELMAFPQIGGEVTHSSYIIVPADSPSQTLEDLRGKSFAFTDPLSYSGRIVPTYMLWKIGETPEGFFGRTVFTYSHANSIKAVARQIVDGAATESAVYNYLVQDDPEYLNKVRIIATLPKTDTLPLVVRPGLDPKLKEQVRRAFLNAHEDPEGRRALDALLVERFRPGEDAAYDVIRRLLKEMGVRP